VAYAAGFLVVNAHLAQFGVSDLDFVSARYFLAAANFAFFLVCFYFFAGRATYKMPGWLSSDCERIAASGGGKKWKKLLFAGSIIRVVFFCCLSAATYTSTALGQAQTLPFYAVLLTGLVIRGPAFDKFDARSPRAAHTIQFAVQLVAVYAFFKAGRLET
jgi:hypothetical protein